MKPAVAPLPTAAPAPLANLFEALRREGFRLRPDDYVEVHQVLAIFRPQTHADLRALIAPLLVTSDEEQEKFDRIFAVFSTKNEVPEPPAPPTQPKRALPWGWLVSGLVALLAFGYVAFFWPAPTFRTNVNLAGNAEIPYEVGDTLRFEVDSSLRRVAGRQVRYAWQTPDGQLHANESEIAVLGRKAGNLVVNVVAQRGQGLLFPNAWQESSASVSFPVCALLPIVRLDSLRLPDSQKFSYRYTARLANPSQSVQATRWRVNGVIVARNQWRLDYTHPLKAVSSACDVRFEVFPDTTQGLCFGEASLSSFLPGTGELPFTLNVRQSGTPITPETRVKNPFRWTAWGLAGILAVLVGWAMRLSQRKPPESSTKPDGDNPLNRFVSDEPPLEIPLENREAELIVRDEAFHEVVRTLRQRTEEETLRLNIPRTLRATLREGGFPTLFFQPRLAEVEYLFLIDRSQVRSQQVALFEYVFRAFFRENVGVERFFFHQKFDLFTSETHPRGLTLRQLTDAYRSRTLVVWGNGYPLLYPPYPVVEPAYREVLAEFEARAVLTPLPFADWGSKERALQDVFLLLPADLPGQVRLMQAFAEKHPRQDAYLRQFADEFYSTEYVDFREVDELREYLADEGLVQWLAAVALYPRLRWEVVVEMGRTVLPPERVNFTNLLKLVRIGWMHEGSFPDYTRFELLKILTPDNEVAARQTLLRMLQHAERYFPGEHFFDGEKHLLQVSNQFTLFAHDSEKYANYQPVQKEFKTLLDKGLYPDATMRRYLENDERQWNTPIGSSSTALPPSKSSGDTDLTRLTREIGELEAEEARLRAQGEAAFQRGQEELASQLAVSRKAVQEQVETAKQELKIEQSKQQPRTSLNDYFANLPADEPEKPPQSRALDPGLRRLLLTVGWVTIALLALLIFMFTSSRTQELDSTQPVPLTVLLDSSACVSVANTNAAGYPRWAVELNDSLMRFASLQATRSFTLDTLLNGSDSAGSGFDEDPEPAWQTWWRETFRPVETDSLNRFVTLTVRDTGNAPLQSRLVALTGDTLRLGIACRENETPYIPVEAVDPDAPPVAARLRVDVFYSEENQTSTQRLARKLAQGLQTGGQYDVQVKLLRTQMNRNPGYRVSGNEIRAEADERAKALELKTAAERILRLEKMQFPLRGVTSNNRTPNYVSLFIVQPTRVATPKPTVRPPSPSTETQTAPNQYEPPAKNPEPTTTPNVQQNPVEQSAQKPETYQQISSPNQNAIPVSTWQRLGQNVSLTDWKVAESAFYSLAEIVKVNPEGRLRVVIHSNAKAYYDYRSQLQKFMGDINQRVTFENIPLNSKAQKAVINLTPYAEVFGIGITPPASAR